jgi:hypothetical protein
MRLFFWGLVAVAVVYGAYAVMMSAWQYFQVSGVVDEALQPYAIKEVGGTARGVKNKILKETADAGIPLGDRDVSVTLAERQLTVNIVWSFPVIIYNGEPVLAIPISLKRQRAMDAASYLPAGRAFASAIIRSTRVRSSPAGTTFRNRSHERIAPAGSFFAS